MPIPNADLIRKQESNGEEESDIPSQNDLLVLSAIGADSDAQNVSFQGMKRKLGLHQETLSRALHRLQRDGFIERLEQGYRISSKGRETIVSNEPNLDSRRSDFFEERYPVSILKAMLPEDVRVEDIVSSLSYKWFGKLRWLGFGESQDSTTMSWITSDSNLRLTVKIKDDALTIESYANDSDTASKAIMSAYELFDHVTKVFKSVSNQSQSVDTNGGKAA